MCQRVNTGESYIFYFGIFICGGPLNTCSATKDEQYVLSIY